MLLVQHRVVAAPCEAPRRRRCVAASSAAGVSAAQTLRPGESPEAAAARRERESERVDERTKLVTSREELDAAFALAPPEALLILSVESEKECALDGLSWASTAVDAQAPCRALRGVLQRVTRECDNVLFVRVDTDAGAQALALAADLGVTTFPTVQYYKAGKLLFQSVGASAGAAEAASQSTLFYADGVRTSDYVSDVTDEPAFRALVASCAAPAVAVRGMALSAPCDKQLLVLDVSAGGVPACVHVFPAVLALAKNTAGALKWARLITDAGPQAKQLADKLGVTTVPTFLFFDAEGAEVGRYVGADRGALMAAVLETQAAVGFTLPEPPPRKRPSVAEAKRIAAEARERDRAAGRKSGW